MSSDIVLTAALRNNLLSLQNTQRLIDSTQLRLATGLKVNSALDNPSSFFTSQALNSRASDLTRLLDSINLSLRTIEEADKGVTALTSLVEQAQATAQSARDELAASTGVARLVGTVDLSNVGNLAAAPFTAAGIAANDTIRIATTDDSGAQIINTFNITANESVAALAARITDTYADTRSGEIISYLDDNGFWVFESKDGRAFGIDSVASASDITVAGWAALGFATQFETQTRTAAANTATTTGTFVVGGNTAASISLYESPGNLADRGDILVGSTFIDANGNTVVSGLSTNTKFAFTVNNSTNTAATTTALTTATTWQDLVEQINQTASITNLIEANFDDATGQFSITSLSDTVENIQIEIQQTVTGANFDIGLGDPTAAVFPFLSNNTAAQTNEQVLTFNSSTETLDSLANDYNEIRAQIDTLVQDANFRGVNLLNGDDLTTFFNEDRTSSLITAGQVFTSNGLGLVETGFRTETGINADLDRVQEALDAVRGFGTTLANSLAIIQTRKAFTEGTINVLKSGAEDLTVADQNEEGANLLALQTRQALGVTSLSLASQSQQSVLRLF